MEASPYHDTTDWEQFRDWRDFRNGQGATVWYRTSGPYSLRHPPTSLRALVDEIYIHHDERSSRSDCWVVDTAGCWVAARSGDRQPSNPLRRLSFQRNGDPSWVTRKTYRIYHNRGRKGDAILSNSMVRTPLIVYTTSLLMRTLLATWLGMIGN